MNDSPFAKNESRSVAVSESIQDILYLLGALLQGYLVTLRVKTIS